MALLDPVLVDGLIVINTIDGPIAIDPATGKDKWRLNIQWGYFVFSPLSEKRLCVWKPDEIFMIDTDTGKTLWQSTADSSVSAGRTLPSPAVATSDIICQLRGSHKNPRDWSLFSLDAASGNIRWKTNLGDFHGARAHARSSPAKWFTACSMKPSLPLTSPPARKSGKPPPNPSTRPPAPCRPTPRRCFFPSSAEAFWRSTPKPESQMARRIIGAVAKEYGTIAGAVVSGDSIYVSRNEFTDKE